MGIANSNLKYSVSQRELALWRSSQFANINSNGFVEERTKESLLGRVFHLIVSEIQSRTPLRLSAGNLQHLSTDLGDILSRLYDWHAAAKQDVLDFELIPFLPELGAPYDPTLMKISQDQAADNADESAFMVRQPLSIGLKVFEALGPSKAPTINVPEKAEAVFLKRMETCTAPFQPGSTEDTDKESGPAMILNNDKPP